MICVFKCAYKMLEISDMLKVPATNTGHQDYIYLCICSSNYQIMFFSFCPNTCFVLEPFFLKQKTSPQTFLTYTKRRNNKTKTPLDCTIVPEILPNPKRKGDHLPIPSFLRGKLLVKS